jgi:hypothetical protein
MLVNGVPLIRAIMAALVLAGIMAAQERVSFPTQDGGSSTPTCMGKAAAASYWLMAAVS